MGLHIVLLAAIPVLVPVLCARWWGRPRPARVVVAVVVPLVIAMLSLAAGVHQCDRGVPVMQWAIPCIAMMMALACIGSARVRWATASSLAVVAFGLSLHFAGLVHGEHLTGNPNGHCALAHPLWHTPLTGFYASEPADCDAARP